MSAKESAVSAAAAELVWSGLGFLLLGLPLDEGDGRSSPTFRDSHLKISVVQISKLNPGQIMALWGHGCRLI